MAARVSVDRAEAEQSATVLKAGRSGSVNFHFYRDGKGAIALEPAKVLMSIPMKDSMTYSKMMTGGGMDSQLGPFMGAFQQIVGNMEAPIVMIYFGKAQTDNMQTGISGNQFRQDVAKNVIRDLGPGVIEQQIVTKSVSKTPTGQVHTGYDEAVMRFKKLSDSRLYVLCASDKYSSNGKYLSKLIMYGTVDRGRRVETNPYANMNQMMGGMMNLNNMQSIFGGSSGQVNVPQGGFPGMKIPNVPNGAAPGFDPNQLLKHMQQLKNK